MANGIIEQIKERLDIVNEIGNVVALKRAGKAYRGLCPFHNERSPSFYVFPESKTWRCFGCNEGGDVFTFVAKQQTLDFPETLKLLAEKAGIDTSFDDGPREPSEQTKARQRLRAMNDTAAVWFHHQLLTAPAAQYARAYLQSRGISNESIERFRLGYAPDGDQLTRYLRAADYTDDEIVTAGLARRRDAERGQGLYDYFRNRVIFTIHDIREQTIGFGGRELGGGTPKYLNSPQTLLFDKSTTLYGMDLAREAVRKGDEIVIVEGYVDALMAHQYGFRNTVAIIGSAITTRHVQVIKKLTRRLVLALDPDAAGEAATLRGIQVAQEGFDRELIPIPVPSTAPAQKPRKGKHGDAAPQGMVRFEEQVNAEIRVLSLPDGVDPDEFIRADPPAWEAAVKDAQPLIDFYFTRLVADLDLRSPSGKAEAGRRLFPVLAPIADRVKQDAYIRQLASLLRIPEEDAYAELRKYRREHTAHQGAQARTQAPESLAEKYQSGEEAKDPSPAQMLPVLGAANPGAALEGHCISILLAYPEVIPEVCVILGASDFWGTETRSLFSLLAVVGGPRSRSTMEAFLATQPEPLRHEAARLTAQYAAQPDLDRTQLAKTARQIAFRIKRQRLKDAINEITYLQRDAEQMSDQETGRTLRQQAQRLTLELHKLDAAHVLQT